MCTKYLGLKFQHTENISVLIRLSGGGGNEPIILARRRWQKSVSLWKGKLHTFAKEECFWNRYLNPKIFVYSVLFSVSSTVSFCGRIKHQRSYFAGLSSELNWFCLLPKYRYKHGGLGERIDAFKTRRQLSREHFRVSLFNLLVMTPLSIKWPFLWGCLRPLENTESYTVIHNSRELQQWSSNANKFMVGVPTTWGPILKGHGIRKAENQGLDSGMVAPLRYLSGWNRPLCLLGKNVILSDMMCASTFQSCKWEGKSWPFPLEVKPEGPVPPKMPVSPKCLLSSPFPRLPLTRQFPHNKTSPRFPSSVTNSPLFLRTWHLTTTAH